MARRPSKPTWSVVTGSIPTPAASRSASTRAGGSTSAQYGHARSRSTKAQLRPALPTFANVSLCDIRPVDVRVGTAVVDGCAAPEHGREDLPTVPLDHDDRRRRRAATSEPGADQRSVGRADDRATAADVGRRRARWPVRSIHDSSARLDGCGVGLALRRADRTHGRSRRPRPIASCGCRDRCRVKGVDPRHSARRRPRAPTGRSRSREHHPADRPSHRGSNVTDESDTFVFTSLRGGPLLNTYFAPRWSKARSTVGLRTRPLPRPAPSRRHRGGDGRRVTAGGDGDDGPLVERRKPPLPQGLREPRSRDRRCHRSADRLDRATHQHRCHFS